MSDKCPKCGMEEVSALHPRTLYACGSSDFDRRPGTFWQSHGCKRIAELKALVKTYESQIEANEMKFHEFVVTVGPFLTYATNNSRTPRNIKAISEGGADDYKWCRREDCFAEANVKWGLCLKHKMESEGGADG